MAKKLTIVFFGAHPDDMEYHMAGTLLKYQQQGHRVHCVIATDGRWGAAKPPKELPQIRKQEALAGAAHLGIKPIFLGYEDGALLQDEKTYSAVRTVYKKLKPDLVFTHDPFDYHADHRTISKLALDVSWVPVFFADTLKGVNFTPQFYIDITRQIAAKKKMLGMHKSQHPESMIKDIDILNSFRAYQCSKKEIKYAECFRLFPRAGWVDAYKLLPV